MCCMLTESAIPARGRAWGQQQQQQQQQDCCKEDNAPDPKHTKYVQLTQRLAKVVQLAY